MRIAILGATSHIAKDLVLAFSKQRVKTLVLYARRPTVVSKWLSDAGIAEQYEVAEFSAFTINMHFDAVFNFVGVGNPAELTAMGPAIFDITLQYDGLALNYVRHHPHCRYIFLSSGASYCSTFETPANQETCAVIPINNFRLQDSYALAKLYAECRHRALKELPIIDIRVFNYFSHTQDLSARFLITDIVRAIRDKTVLQVSSSYMVRDYLHPIDFYRLISALLAAPPTNAVVDCFSKAPIDKPELLFAMASEFGLQFEFQESGGLDATGTKPHYYSLNHHAATFGYRPTLTSLEGLLQEVGLALAQHISS